MPNDVAALEIRIVDGGTGDAGSASGGSARSSSGGNASVASAMTPAQVGTSTAGKPVGPTATPDPTKLPGWANFANQVGPVIGQGNVGTRAATMAQGFQNATGIGLPSVQAVSPQAAASFVGPLQVAKPIATSGMLGTGITAAGAATGAAVAVGAVIAATAAVTKLTQVMESRARELSQYSPQIAASVARADVREIMAEFREANLLGGDYAKLVDAVSDVQMELRELVLPIKQAILRGLIPIVEMAAQSPAAWSAATGFLEVISGVVSGTIEGGVKAAAGSLETIASTFGIAMRKNDATNSANQILDEFMKLGDPANMVNYNRGRDPIRDAAGAGMRPAFGKL